MKSFKFHILLLLLPTTFLLSGCDISDIFDPQADFAVDKGWWPVCAVIKDKDSARQQSRRDNCYSRVADKKSEVSICEKITGDQIKKDNCISKIAIAVGGDLLCNKIGDETIKNNCLMSVAFGRNDYLVCNKITQKRQADECFRSVAITTKDINLCQTIETVDLKNECLALVSSDNKNTDYCKLITPTSRLYFTCYYDAANKAKDASLCTSIESAGTRDKCYHNVAYTQHDKSVCTNIKDQTEKSNCEKYTTSSSLQE
jgi:hypothetical protein